MSDFNIKDADDPRDTSTIPAGIYRFRATIKKGGHGNGGWYKLAKSGRTWGINFELKVIGGRA